MRPLSEAEAEELLAAYVLNALPPDEAAEVAAHLRGCNEHRRSAAELASAATSLALMVDDREPPAALRQRVVDAIQRSSRQAEPGAPAPAIVPPAARSTIGWRRARPPLPLITAAAAAIALAIGILVGTRIANPGQQSWTFHGNQLAPQGQATLVYDRDHHSAVLAVTGLPSLGPGQLYEVWLIRGAAPIEAGISNQPNGIAVVRISNDPTQFQTLAITVETREQAHPTTPPILAGQLQ